MMSLSVVSLYISMSISLSSSPSLNFFLSVSLSVSVPHCLYLSWSATRTLSFFYLFQSIFPSFSTSISISICLCLPFSVRKSILSVCLFLHPSSRCLSVYLAFSLCQPVYLSFCYLSTRMSLNCLLGRHSVCQSLSLCLSLYVSIRLFLFFTCLSLSPTIA